MNLDDLRDCLAQEAEILENIVANTERQIRFIKKREIKGLQRLIREREDLIGQLFEVKARLDKNDIYQNTDAELQSLVQIIDNNKKQIQDYSIQAFEAVKSERERISLELKRIRNQKIARNQYGRRRFPEPGSRFNKKK